MEAAARRTVREPAPIRIGISSCLLGHAVRWDGRHKRDAFLAGRLGRVVEWVPVCPELELGMGVPREPIRLVAHGAGSRLVAVSSAIDWTARMRAFAQRRVRALARLGLCGYVLQAGSPSCGLARVPVWSASGRAARRGRGLFARVLAEALPELPIVEEGQLADSSVRDHWLERVFALHRLRALGDRGWSGAALAAFHAAHELQLLAHAPALLRRLDRLVGAAGALLAGAARPRARGACPRGAAPRRAPAAIAARYRAGFLEALRRPATRAGELRALRCALARLAPALDAEERRALAALAERAARDAGALRAARTRVRRLAARRGAASLAAQTWLAPDPRERALRAR